MDQTFTPSTNEPSNVILIVDDEDYVADMIATVLHMEGFTTYVAYNGRLGLEKAHEQHLDLVIIDIMMPYLDGVELLQHIRESHEYRELPAIFMSAGAQPQAALPRTWFLPKPFDIEDVLALVRQILASP